MAAIRIRSQFHASGRERSAATLASVIAMLAWKLAIDSIKRMREAKFDIDLGRSYFDFVCEYLAFLAHLADRIAYRGRLWWLAGHRSTEPAHTISLDRLQLDPVVDFGLRLGEGTGALLALPILRAAGATLAEMATFDEAGVSGSDEVAASDEGAGDGPQDGDR